MNCKQCQEKILESLAAGEDLLAPEIAAHRNSCVACNEFYDAQRSLFQSVDAALRSLVNQPVPPSLLPAMRARLDEESLPRHAWISTWSLAVVAAVAILAVSVGYVLRRPENRSASSENTSIATHSVGNQQPTGQIQMQPQPAKVLPIPSFKRAMPTVPSPAAPEVIVLAEERQAFAKFVAELPEEGNVALALTRPAPPMADSPVEIALLQIEEVEVKPLEGTPNE
jgi:hypothetical protein